MADVGTGLDVEFRQQVEVAGSGIDLGCDLGIGELVRDFVGFAEVALDLNEEGNHARLRPATAIEQKRAAVASDCLP